MSRNHGALRVHSIWLALAIAMGHPLTGCGKSGSTAGPASPAPAPAAGDAVPGGSPTAEAGAATESPAIEARRQPLGAITVLVPEGWRPEPAESRLRKAAWRIDGAGGPATLIVYYYGRSGSRRVPERWYEELWQPDRRPTRDVAEGSVEVVAGMKVTRVAAGGRYWRLTQPQPGGDERPETAEIPDAYMLGAVVEAADGPYYFQMLGPAATVKAAASGFDAMLRSLAPAAQQPDAAGSTPASGDAAAQADASTIPAPPDVAAPPADAARTASGLAYKHLREGTGPSPDAWDAAWVHYTSWTTNGQLTDSSLIRGQPGKVELAKVIPGWTEGLQLMKIGGSMRLWIPGHLAYDGMPARPQGMQVFDIELLDVEDLPRPPPVPEDVAAPPSSARKTRRGVFYKVLTPGTGKEHPGPSSTVLVHYSGWTTDGKMFDSSVVRGEPGRFPLERVIPGFREGLQTMVVGEKTRFWIPQELAYAGRYGAPRGMLVFEVELLAIE